MPESVLAFENVSMTYPAGTGATRAVLQDVTFTLDAGRSVALVGRSGSGKSTLLHLAAGIARPTAGRILLGVTDLTACSEKERTHVRGRDIGLVFQFFHLLPHLTVRENVALPGWVAGQGQAQLGQRADSLLERVDLAARRLDPVAKLSGGEMQRVAICRALLRSPRLVLADEPTGSLDDHTGTQVMDLLHELVREEGSTLLYVTHSRQMTKGADAIWELRDGVLNGESTS